MVEVFGILKESIFSTDWPIGIAALLEVCFLVLALGFSKNLEIKVDEIKRKRGKVKASNDWFMLFYNLFVTTISIFPLLGMLGTVWALLQLDLSVGDMENIKNNFFHALTSTAWGIIFSIIFKFFYAIFANRFEKRIKASVKAAEIFNKELEDKR